jgi:hypothetical protein
MRYGEGGRPHAGPWKKILLKNFTLLSAKWNLVPLLPSACISRLNLLHREKKDKERRWTYTSGVKGEERIRGLEPCKEDS